MLSVLGWALSPVPALETLPPELAGELTTLALKLGASMPQTIAALIDIGVEQKLLRMNANLDVGAICIADFRNEDNESISYFTLRASHLVQTADFEEVWEMVEKVAGVADALEKDIYASDIH